MSQVNREPATATAKLHITMFGRFRIERDGETLKPNRPPDFRMLAYLLLHHDRPVDRQEAALIWKKESETSGAIRESEARAYLARAVSALKSKLGREETRLQKPDTQLLLFDTTGTDLDLLRWEAGLSKGSLEALEDLAPLYRRPFLEGWDDSWIYEARTRFRNDYVRALRSVARREIDHCHWKRALRAFTLLSEIDPWNDETLRAHLQLLADRRRYQEMQRLYDAYARHCDTELARPDPETVRFYRALRASADLRGDNLPGWLPTPLSPFIPRPTAVQEICREVRSKRLITLTGPGGVGKTRLAIAAAEEISEAFYDRVWFIDLADIQDPVEAPTQMARALSLAENKDRTATEEILGFLRTREALLVLDNCEHLLEVSARLTQRILEKCPDVKILATSRPPLGITGEALWRVPSLEFPAQGARIRPQKATTFSAVRLLVERASQPQFPITIDTNNMDAVARICRRLDGIPLAIELAAVQVSRRLHSFQEVADSLDNSLSFLTNGSTTAPSRQQTLRAAIEWSYRLLSEVEQRVFARLGVFVGGFTQEAAGAICADRFLAQDEVIQAVRTLADKSLVECTQSESGSRFHLLQTIRRYALERLTQQAQTPPSPGPPITAHRDVPTEIGRRHLEYYAAFVEEAERHHRDPDQALWLDRQANEHENFRAALTWARQQGENATGLRLANSLAVYLVTRGYPTEAAAWLTEFLERTPDASASLRQRAIHWLGNIAYLRGDYTPAHAYFTEGLALRKAHGDPRSIAVGQASLAMVSGAQGYHQEALDLFESNLEVFRKLDDLRNMAMSWNSIALMADALGDHSRARNAYVESLGLFRQIGDSVHIGLAASNLVGISIRLEEYAIVRPLLAECVALYRTLQTRPRFVFVLIHYACLAIRESDFARAATIFGFESTFRARIGYTLPPQISDQCRAEVDRTRECIGEKRFEAHFTLGLQMSEEEMLTFLLEG